jgi:ABC-type glycerol-3-phosphate transport system substrate-binding protein
MSYKPLIALVVSLGLATPAAAVMTVGTFLAKAAPLRANPFTALTNPDYPVLKAEADAATRQLRAEGAARMAAGKPPIACLPEGQSIGILQMLGGLDALSPADKKLPLKDGYARVLAKTYPCEQR